MSLPYGAQGYVAAFTNEILGSDAADAVEGRLELSWRRLRNPTRVQAIVRVWLQGREYAEARETLVADMAEHRAPDDAGRSDARRLLEHLKRAVEAGAMKQPSVD